MVTTTATDTAGLLEAYREGRDSAAREQLVARHLPLVRKLCGRFGASREPQEDLLQVGAIGLLSAIEKFDPSHGVKFTSLAVPVILGAILNYLRDHGSLLKVPRSVRRNALAVGRESERLAARLGRWPTIAELAAACELSHDEVCAARELARTGLPRSLDERMNTSDEEEAVTLLDFVGSEANRFERSLDRMALATALQGLPSREREVLRLRFYHGMSQRQTAGHVNISQMHVSRLERRALLKLRRLMQGGPADTGPPAYMPPAA